MAAGGDQDYNSQQAAPPRHPIGCIDPRGANKHQGPSALPERRGSLRQQCTTGVVGAVPSRWRRAVVAGGGHGLRRLRSGGGRRTRRVAGSGRGRPGSIPDVSFRGRRCRRRRSLSAPVRRPPWAVSTGAPRPGGGRQGGREGSGEGLRGTRDSQGAAARPPARLSRAPWGRPSSRAARSPRSPPGRRGAPLRGVSLGAALSPWPALRGFPFLAFRGSLWILYSPPRRERPISWWRQVFLGKEGSSLAPWCPVTGPLCLAGTPGPGHPRLECAWCGTEAGRDGLSGWRLVITLSITLSE